MSARRITAVALAGALLAGGAGAAVAAISKDDGKNAEQSILDNAAKRLDVTPQALRDALSAAQADQLDQAVKDGLLTQKQADAIKAHRKQDGRVLGGSFGRHGFGLKGGPGFGLEGGPGFGHYKGGLMLFDDFAKALDLTTPKLFERLRDGKSVADVAKAQGKSLDDVHATVKAAVKARADKAVKDGDITQAQADEKLSHLDDALRRIETLKPFIGPRHFRHGAPGLPGGRGNRPGSFMAPPSSEGVLG